MTIKTQLENLAKATGTPCVTISLNTHRTHPDNAQDEILLKKLLKEAEDRVVNEFEKRAVAPLLEKIANVGKSIDVNHNLDSLHLFLSNDTQEIMKSSLPILTSSVQISDKFNIRPMIKEYVRGSHYLIMLLSQSGVHLYEASNDQIVDEIKNEDFPFSENRHFLTDADKLSDGKQVDNMVREFLNKVDKAFVKVQQEKELQAVVICTEDNRGRLMQVADRPNAYIGFAPIDYNNSAPHHIVAQAYEIVEAHLKTERTTAIEDMQEAVAKGNVLTDLQEIYQAALDGRGATLIVHQDFSQAVMMKDERTFDRITDVTLPNAIDDITSTIAWEVISKKGNVIFTAQDEIKNLGEIVLKTRF